MVERHDLGLGLEAQLRAFVEQLASLKVEVATTTEVVREEKKVAAAHREKVWTNLSAVPPQLVSTDNSIKQVMREVEEIKPVVRVLDDSRLMALGAGKAAIFISRAGYVLIGAIIG